MKLKTLYGLPSKVVFCKKSLISNQRPNSAVEMQNNGKNKETIQFSSDNLCSACQHNFSKKKTDWSQREKDLFNLLEPYRSKDGSYDVLVPSSGGKDSSFAAHILKYKYKMNPLAVTWAPNIFTHAGWNNFNNLSRIGGVDSFLYTPNGKLHSLLTRLAFKNLGHPFQPFVHGQKIIGPKLANKLNIGINAGHDLSLENLNYFDSKITDLLEVSIGHALISDSLIYGLEKTIKLYLGKLCN